MDQQQLIELILKATDQTAPAFRAVTAAINQQTAQVRAAAQEQTAAVQGAARQQVAAQQAAARQQVAAQQAASAAQIATIRAQAQVQVATIRAAAQEQAAAMRQATGGGFGAGFGSFISTLDHGLSLIGRFSSGLEGLVGQIVGGMIGAFERLGQVTLRVGEEIGGLLQRAFVETAKAGVDMHVTLDRATLALTKIGGSAQGAAVLIGQIKAEALTSSLTFKELIPIGQQLAAVYGPAGLGKVVPTIRAFGDVAATLGVDSAGLERALLGFRQLVSAPKVNARDLRQIGENLPGSNPNQLLAQAFGTGDTEVLAKAGVTGAQAADAVVRGFIQRFGGAQVELSHTLPIILSNFQDAFNNLAQEVTNHFAPALTRGLDQALQAVQGLATNERVISALAVPFDLLGRAIEVAAQHLPAFIEWLSGILTRRNVVEVLAQVVGYIQAIGQEVARFLGVVANGATFAQIWQVFEQAAEKAIDTALRAWNAFVAAVQFFVQNAPEMWAIAADSMKPLLKVFDTLLGVATVLAGGKLLGGLGGVLGGAGALGGAAALFGGMGALGGAGALLTPKTDGGVPAAIARWLGVGKQPGGSPAGAAAGAAGDALANVGKGVRETIFGGLEAAFAAGGNAVPERVKNLFNRFKDQVGQAWEQGGLAPFQQRARANADAARKAIDSALGAAGGIAGPAAGGGGAGGVPGAPGAAAATGPLSAKDARAERGFLRTYFDAQLQAARAAVEALPEQEQAAAAVQALTPILQQKMAAIKEEGAAVAQGSKEYYDLVADYWTAQKQMNDLAGRATKEQAEQVKKAGEAAKKTREDQLRTADLSVKLAEEQVKNRGLGRAAAVPAMLREFGLLGQAPAGETEEERTRRLLESEQVRGKILEAEGVGESARRGVKLGGGGSIDLADRGKLGAWNRYLDQLQQRGGAPSGNAAPAVKVEVTGQQPLAAMLAAVLQDPKAAQLLAQFLAGLMNDLQNRGGGGFAPVPP